MKYRGVFMSSKCIRDTVNKVKAKYQESDQMCIRDSLYTSVSTFSALMIGYSGAMDCMISANLAIVNGDAIR